MADKAWGSSYLSPHRWDERHPPAHSLLQGTKKPNLSLHACVASASHYHGLSLASKNVPVSVRQSTTAPNLSPTPVQTSASAAPAILKESTVSITEFNPNPFASHFLTKLALKVVSFHRTTSTRKTSYAALSRMYL